MRETIEHCPMCEGEMQGEFYLDNPYIKYMGSCVECGYVTVLAKLVEEHYDD